MRTAICKLCGKPADILDLGAFEYQLALSGKVPVICLNCIDIHNIYVEEMGGGAKRAWYEGMKYLKYKHVYYRLGR